MEHYTEIYYVDGVGLSAVPKKASTASKLLNSAQPVQTLKTDGSHKQT